MTPNFHSPLTPFPLDLKEDQHHQLFFLNSQSSTSSSSTAPCPNFFEPAQEQAGGYYQKEMYQLQHQQEAKMFVSQEGSWDHLTTVTNESDSGLKFSIWKKEERNENQSENSTSVKWMSSKMRLMKKMMHSDDGDNIPNNSMQKFEDHHKQPSETNHNNSYSTNNNTTTTIRVCADCNTTKTPLWRSGPRGPKSLCNACGIRQRKARRAMAAAAAAAANGTALAADTKSKKSKVHHKDKTSSSNNSSLPFKKRCQFGSPSRGKKKLCFEDLTIILSKNSAFQRVFPQDEKEAAILLMALSYGLVQG
ncbi:hypothetical protein Pint_13384 [Pistacia integerrima]|uniref:Uncharacterized protein n=1 Tax=Pistacia integerrima TaxID=434235 RepID=A0ACC0Y624_9ROSI|nr:hypothetical protein Pint_13384 [Pistacia integerrima]